MKDILVPVSPGELIDKLTILRIKSERIADLEKLMNVRHEFQALQSVADAQLESNDVLKRLWEQLYQINCDLWTIEDDIRAFESRSDFGPGFIALARAVYVTNDQRADIKKQINMVTGSQIVEEKSYHTTDKPDV